MDPPESGTVLHHFSFGDCYVAVRERSGVPLSGDFGGPVLFFLHGRFGHSETWGPVFERLLPRFRCISLDLPGFGRSFSAHERGLTLLEHANLVGVLLRKLLIPGEKVILIGHDIGGAIVQLASIDMNPCLAGIILINCTGLCEPVRGLQAGWFGWRTRWQLNQLLNQSKLMAFSLERLLLAPWSVGLTRHSLIEALHALQTSWPGPFERQFWKKEIQNLPVPVMLLWGANDTINPAEIGLRMVRDLPEAYFYQRADVGHWPQLEIPEWVSAKIQEFSFRLLVNKSA